ncbi:MAG: hypothetical protein ACQEQV_04955 [Fibrobacterota bacterium]
MKILFICTGNICRSPFAEGYAAAHFGNRGTEFLSRGIADLTNRPVPPAGIRIGRTFSVDLRGHRAQCVDRKVLEAADMILVMEQRHADYLRHRFPLPGIAARIHLLRTCGRKFVLRKSIPDPHGKSDRAFLRSYKIITKKLDRLLPQIL